jgi:hypothetical protein
MTPATIIHLGSISGWFLTKAAGSAGTESETDCLVPRLGTCVFSEKLINRN